MTAGDDNHEHKWEIDATAVPRWPPQYRLLCACGAAMHVEASSYRDGRLVRLS